MVDVESADGGLRELALFAGAGGGILGGKLLGWRTVCAVERDAYAAAVLAQRQNDRCLEPFPIWSDVETFDGKPWRGIVDVVSGGFPCQDISAAGKGEGIAGERSGLWREFARIIGEVRPRYAFIENSPMLTIRGLDVVLADLAALGFDARWGCISAASIGAPHNRNRIWIVAYANSFGSRQVDTHSTNGDGRKVSGDPRQGCSDGGKRNVADATSLRQQGQGQLIKPRNTATKENGEAVDAFTGGERKVWGVEPQLGRVANGVAYRVDRLRAIGNGQVPQCAATAFRILSGIGE